LLRAGVDPQGLAGVVVTHSHCDHINGLPGLAFSMRLGGREESLPIYGLEPTLEILRATFEAMRVEYHVPLDWRPIAAGDSIPLADGWRIRTAPTTHSRPCVALRFERGAGGPALVCSADTEPCPAVQELAAGAAVIIHEATTPGPFAGHTSPRQAGAVAAAAGASRLILVHYSPRWTMPEEAALAEMRAGGFTGQAEVGRDGQVIEL
jgi:ribonuclease Z